MVNVSCEGYQTSIIKDYQISVIKVSWLGWWRLPKYDDVIDHGDEGLQMTVVKNLDHCSEGCHTIVMKAIKPLLWKLPHHLESVKQLWQYCIQMVVVKAPIPLSLIWWINMMIYKPSCEGYQIVVVKVTIAWCLIKLCQLCLKLKFMSTCHHLSLHGLCWLVR